MSDIFILSQHGASMILEMGPFNTIAAVSKHNFRQLSDPTWQKSPTDTAEWKCLNLAYKSLETPSSYSKPGICI